MEIKNNYNHWLKRSHHILIFEIKIIGHTDADGTDNYNEILAKQRASSVHDYLKELGTTGKNVYLDWKGERTPIADGHSAKAKKKNRRVELKYKTYDFESVDEMISFMHEVELQQYAISGNDATEIELDKGSSINIPENCFEYADGNGAPNGEIKIEVKETFDYADFISENLFTSSGDEILETGGMLYINATANGMPLSIKEGQEIEIIYPLQETKEGMELFYADNNGNAVNDIDWVAASQPIQTNSSKKFKVDVDIDFTPLLDYDFDIPEWPQLSFSPMPAKPQMIKKPFPPSKKIYLYEEEKYNKLYAGYLKKVEDFENRIPVYEKKMREWDREISRRLQILYDHKRRLKEYHGYAKTQAAIKTIRNLIGKKSNLELVILFDKMINNKIDFKLSERKIYSEVFGDQTQDVLKHRKINPEILDYRFLALHGEHKLRALIRECKNKSIEKAYALNGTIDKKGFNSYVTNIKKLGWINCDRFRDYPEYLMTSLDIRDLDEETRYYLIFKDVRSMLGPKRLKDKLSWTRVPQKENVKIIGVKLVGNKPHIAVKDYVITETNDLTLDFVPGSLIEIKEHLNALQSD